MKATGIVRRIDDLGRVVIPKEIRRSIHLRDGDLLELYLENGCVLFKKYSSMEDNEEYFSAAQKALARDGVECAFYDRDIYICGARSLSKLPIDEMDSHCSGTIEGNCYNSIMVEGECIGFVVYKDAKHSDRVETACRMIVNLLETN